MKPDWQNKSYAKTSSPTGPSTTHAKLKVGMSSLHGKISAANNNMPKTPKPAVRKFADGGVVRTRSDDQIWWESQPGNRGKTYPGDDIASKQYELNKARGEENLSKLKSAARSIASFFSRDKEAESSSANITGDSGMKDSDVAKKQAMSGGMDFENKAEPVAEPKVEPKAEEPRRKIEDYIKSAPVVQSSTQAGNLPAAADASAAPASAASAPAASAPAAPASDNASSSKKIVSSPKKTANKKVVVDAKNYEKKAETQNLLARYPAPDIAVPKPKKTYRSLSGKIVEIDDNIKTGGKNPVSDFFSNADKRYLKSKIDRGEELTPMEKAQAKRAGIL